MNQIKYEKTRELNANVARKKAELEKVRVLHLLHEVHVLYVLPVLSEMMIQLMKYTSQHHPCMIRSVVN